MEVAQDPALQRPGQRLDVLLSKRGGFVEADRTVNRAVRLFGEDAVRAEKVEVRAWIALPYAKSSSRYLISE